MSGEPAPTTEVVQTPRQRVEASFAKRQQTANDLNHLSFLWTDRGHRFTDVEKTDHWKKQSLLEQRLRDQNLKFQKEIVSKLPEAEAWVQIEKENVEATLRSKGLQVRQGTPTDRSYEELILAFANRDYTDALENLRRVREQNANPSVVTSKTP